MSDRISQVGLDRARTRQHMAGKPKFDLQKTQAEEIAQLKDD